MSEVHELPEPNHDERALARLISQYGSDRSGLRYAVAVREFAKHSGIPCVIGAFGRLMPEQQRVWFARADEILVSHTQEIAA